MIQKQCKIFYNDTKKQCKRHSRMIRKTMQNIRKITLDSGQNDADFFAQSRGNCSKIIRSRILHNDAALGLINKRYGDANC